MELARFTERPNDLARDYTRFRVGERLLLTGHSHQAWPDVAWAGPREALEDAAAHLDGKWERVEARAALVRAGYAARLADPDGIFTLAPSVHELVARFLSALPLGVRPHLLTTGSEFHSLRRQLARLAESGAAVEWIPARPAADVGSRLAERLTDRTAAVIVSAVFFDSGLRAGGLAELAAHCAARDVPLLVDAYHALNVVPFTIREHALERAYVVGGGYKYMQLGEGNAFLRTPPDCDLRPVYTGWFAEFDTREVTLDPTSAHPAVAYPTGPGRFAGSTVDPTPYYRATHVLRYFADRDLGPALLRALSAHQLRVLANGFDELDLDPTRIDRDRSVALEQHGGFVCFQSAHAPELARALGERGVLCDARGDRLRFGPAPYLCDDQLCEALDHLRQAVIALKADAPGSALRSR